MKLFDEIQARYLTPEAGSGRTYGRLGTNNGLCADLGFSLEKMQPDDRKFQQEMNKALRETVRSTLANLSRSRER